MYHRWPSSLRSISRHQTSNFVVPDCNNTTSRIRASGLRDKRSATGRKQTRNSSIRGDVNRLSSTMLQPGSESCNISGPSRHPSPDFSPREDLERSTVNRELPSRALRSQRARLANRNIFPGTPCAANEERVIRLRRR